MYRITAGAHPLESRTVIAKDKPSKPDEGRNRVIIEEVRPEIDCGRHAVKRILGDTVTITAVLYTDGHDHVAADLLYKRSGERAWRRAPFREFDNDNWTAEFAVDSIGPWVYTVQAWTDHVGTWVRDLHKRIDAQQQPGAAIEQAGGAEQNEGVNAADQNNVAQQELSAGQKKGHDSTSASPNPEGDIAVAFRIGAALFDQAAERARGADARLLKKTAGALSALAERNERFYDFPLNDDTIAKALLYPDRSYATTYSRELPLWVDRERARFSSWYEFFPRSAGEAGKHGTLRDAAARLPAVAAMGFNVVYLPPIHPIGSAFRKGKNNSVVALPGDVGSPWAIGNTDGGHKAILRELGNFDDFAALVVEAKKVGLEIALDIAFQCAPEHPWVKEHPDWFIVRPDGTIQYAENPPKKYQDIYPLNFESSDWRALWKELLSVFLFWIDKGVHIFRVDNPHTKAIPFWEWCIARVHAAHPEVIFLAEAFTRPHVMYGLAKRGYTQSYTYFSWRTEKNELTAYMTEITTPPVSEFFRGNLWPNTPDILPGFLQTENRAAFAQRVILAATLGANYGIYGPAYELGEHLPAKPGSEEYLNSEKYELRTWDRDDPRSLAPLIAKLNSIRNEHPALQRDDRLRFHGINNDRLIVYSKRREDDIVLVVVNLDPDNEQTGWTDLNLGELDLSQDSSYSVLDLLSGDIYNWHGGYNYVALNPQKNPAHILLLHSPHLSE